MLWTFSNFKGMRIAKSPVPNWLCTESDICCSWPRRQLIVIEIDENWLDRLGPTRYDFATKDALLRATLIRAGTRFFNYSNDSLQCSMRGQDGFKEGCERLTTLESRFPPLGGLLRIESLSTLSSSQSERPPVFSIIVDFGLDLDLLWFKFRMDVISTSSDSDLLSNFALDFFCFEVMADVIRLTPTLLLLVAEVRERVPPFWASEWDWQLSSQNSRLYLS